MSLTLVSATEVREMLGRLEVTKIDGVPYVNAHDLMRACEQLAGNHSPGLAEAVDTREKLDVHPGYAAVMERVEAERTSPPMPAPAEAIVDDEMNLVERERALLAALPPGPCAACTCPTKIAHPEGRCVDCDCTPYVDSTERDPVVTLAARGITEAPNAEITPAVSMFDVAAMGLDHREPMSNRFVG